MYVFFFQSNEPEFPTTIVQCEGQNRSEQFRLYPHNASPVQISSRLQAQASQTIPGYIPGYPDEICQKLRQQ